MSRLIAINLDTCQDPVHEGQEYGYCVFEELPNIFIIRQVLPKADVTLNKIMVFSVHSDTNLKLNITCEKLVPIAARGSLL